VVEIAQSRVEISSSAFPNFGPNQNPGNPVTTDTEWKIAKQTIFHDEARPSCIILPILKAKKPEDRRD
jgi:predicted acyl esterase